MAADPLSYLTDADFAAVKAGDLTKVSDTGLKILKGETSQAGGFVTGLRELWDAPAQMLEHAVKDVAPGVANFLTKYGGSAEEAANKSRAAIANTYGGMPGGAGQVGGNIVGSVLGGRAAQAAGAIPRALASFATRNPWTAAAATGAVTAPLTSYVEPGEQDNYWTEKGKQAGFGAVGGTVGRGLAQGAGRFMGGVQLSPEAAHLRSLGVPLTPGRVLGGGAQSWEAHATTAPFLGSAIERSFNRDVDALNRALYQRALDPIGQGGRAATLQVGREGVRGVRDTLSAAYDAVLPRVRFNATDPVFQQNMGQLTHLMQAMPEDLIRVFNHTMNNTINRQVTPHGLASGHSMKEIESELRRVARLYRGSDRAPERALADALDEVGSQIRQSLARTNPQEAAALTAIDRGWREYSYLRDAASRVGSRGGRITPAQLEMAVRKGDLTTGHGGFATGTTRGVETSDAAREVMSKAPDSGTARRVIGALGLTTGLLTDPTKIVHGVALPLVLSQLYRPGVQRRIVDTMINPPQVMRQTGQALQGMSPYASIVGAELAAQ